MDYSSTNKRIAKNTVVLYLRMIVLALIHLYSSRLVLKVLGVDDFGIYNAVGGFVAMFSLLSGALNNAIGRFITFELGKGDKVRLKEVFSSSVSVQIFLALGVIVISEAVGIWFLNTQMNIPDGRMFAANWVFQCSLLTFAVNLISVPYNACIIAHERMTAFAYISILDVCLRLAAVFMLFFIGGDSLIMYAILLLVVAILVRIIYGAYCSFNFEECHYSFSFNKGLIKEMTSLASWNMLGSSSSVLNAHGVNLLMNIFFGVAANAARGLASQVSAAVTQFVHSFTTAVNPQITKSYAKGDLSYSISLAMISSKYSFFLMLLMVAPLCVETPTILKIWLVDVPDYAVLFVRLTLIMATIPTLSVSLYTLALATGHIKKYQIVIGSLSLSSFFFVYLAYKLGMTVESAYYINILINVFILFARIKILSDMVGLNQKEYIKKVVYRAVVVAIVVSAVLYYFKILFTIQGIAGFVISILFSIAVTLLFIFFLGLNMSERNKFVSKFVVAYKNRFTCKR